MYTPQPIEPLIPRSHIKPGTAATALGVFVAIAVAVLLLTLTGTNHHTTAAVIVPTSQPAATTTPHTEYLGPEQQQALTGSYGAGSAATGDTAARYACLGAPQRCLR
jgi:hypothetical protein